MTRTETARIGLIHALDESVLPARAAFARHWPEAWCFDLLDTSLAPDLAAAGSLRPDMMRRFEVLADYAATAGGKAAGLLFTCSAFGPAIAPLQDRLGIPVLKPNEAALAQALEIGDRIGLVVSFEPSRPSLAREVEEMAERLGRRISVHAVVAQGALAALKDGDGSRHDRLVGEAAQGLEDVDVIVLGQFSLARSRPVVEALVSVPVLTTPDSAVTTLRRLIADGGSGPRGEPRISQG
ncbi:MAG: arylsulfatase [Rhizobiaceae bacterium]|nr:arylsulfatase [Rhizobiaceae bacterium]